MFVCLPVYALCLGQIFEFVNVTIWVLMFVNELVFVYKKVKLLKAK